MDTNNVSEDAGLFRLSENLIETKKEKHLTVRQNTAPRKSVTGTDYNIPVESHENPVVLSPEYISDEYDIRSGSEAGLLVIFNHYEFRELSPRVGTDKDVENLIDCFSRLRYEVRTDMIFNDLTKPEVEMQLKEIAQMDHKHRNSLIVVFLTHGDSDGKLHCSDDLYLTSEEIWNSFSSISCPTMQGKPKVFIFQACKGKNRSLVYGVEEDSVRMEAAKRTYTLPAEADILVAYSTVEGNVSFRHTDTGSWFIQELCKNFTAYGRREDLVSIITRVSKCVAYHYNHSSYKQMPCFISTLTRKFYLCDSKERGFLLDLSENTKLLLNRMEHVERTVDYWSEYKKDKNNKEKSSKAMQGKQIKKSNLGTKDKPKWKI